MLGEKNTSYGKQTLLRTPRPNLAVMHSKGSSQWSTELPLSQAPSLHTEACALSWERHHTADFAPYNRLPLLANSWHKSRAAFGSDALLATGCHHLPGTTFCSALKLRTSDTSAHVIHKQREQSHFMTCAQGHDTHWRNFLLCLPSLCIFQCAHRNERKGLKCATNP